MVSTRAKWKAVALDETTRNRTWDCEYDIYIHMQKKNWVLKSGTERFNYFNTLMQKFVVKNPKGDPELMQSMGGFNSIVQSQVLHLQDQNREEINVEENGTEKEVEDSVMVDPQYKYFMDHVRPHGKSYVLDIIEDDVFVKYEDESLISGNSAVCAIDLVSDEAEANVSLDSQECRGKKMKSGKLSAAKNHNVNSSDVASKTQKHSSNCKDKSKSKRSKNHYVPKDVNGKVVSPMKAACFAKTKGQTIDHKKKGKQIDTPSDTETEVKEEIEDYDDDDAPDIRRPVQSSVLEVEYCWHDNEANARKRTEFAEKLRKELKMPYCKEEHMRLLHDITLRKPVQHHKDLRCGIKIYEEDYPGKSFLDHHLDLAKEIDSAGDDYLRVLNLLRGFFFWLKNLSHEGSFMPWRVPCCLDLLPQQ